MGIAAEFSAILGDLANLSSLVNNVFNLGAKQDTAQSTLANTQVTIIGLAQVQQTLAAIQQQLNAIQGNEANLQSNLGYQISQVQLATKPVLLPPTPPAGYGGGAPSDVAEAVWHYGEPPFDFVPFTAITGLWQYLVAIRDTIGLPLNYSDKFLVQGDLFSQDFYPWPVPPEINPSDILPTDTDRLAWLTRVAPEFAWTYRPVADVYYASFPGGADGKLWCILSQQEFLWYRAAASGILPGTGAAPVWPGLDKVTLGAPVAFSGSTLSVAGPMDGVIVTITAVPQPLPHYHYGTAEAWGRLGGLTFLDDNGQAEEYQLFGFVDAVFSPRAMKQAQSCQIRHLSGMVGTVTPWTIA